MPAPIVENAVFFPLDGFSSLVKDQVTIGVWVQFWVFNSIPLIYLSVAIPLPCSFFFNHNYYVEHLYFYLFISFIGYLFHLHFQCYPKSRPHPPTPTPIPTHSHFLALAFPCTEANKVCRSNGPLFPLMAD